MSRSMRSVRTSRRKRPSSSRFSIVRAPAGPRPGVEGDLLGPCAHGALRQVELSCYGADGLAVSTRSSPRRAETEVPPPRRGAGRSATGESGPGSRIRPLAAKVPGRGRLGSYRPAYEMVNPYLLTSTVARRRTAGNADAVQDVNKACGRVTVPGFRSAAWVAWSR